jgi:purine-nucleoside phosphorylase
MIGTPHIEAAQGDFAGTVLMPGDPLRAKALAERHLEGASQVNSVRNMLAFTGRYRGRRVSIMGSGMGMPSISIYAHELFDYYGVGRIIRVGTCGGLLADMQVGDLVLASSASTDSAMGEHYSHVAEVFEADPALLQRVEERATAKGLPIRSGKVFATDWFYHPDPGFIDRLCADGVLAIDMESAALYGLARQMGRQALTILSVSDVIPTGERASHAARQNAFGTAVEAVLEAALETED